MTGWTEDNFLEEMIPLLNRQPGARQCPSANVACAVIDGNASDATRHAFALHAAGCSACATLHRRLLSFGAMELPERDQAWGPVEARLDAWLETFLAPPAAVYRAPHPIEASGHQRGWRRLAAWFDALRSSWLLIPAAAALAICPLLGLLLLLNNQSLPVTARVERTRPAAQLQAAAPPSAAQTDRHDRPTASLRRRPANAPIRAIAAQPGPVAHASPPRAPAHQTLPGQNSAASTPAPERAVAEADRPTQAASLSTITSAGISKQPARFEGAAPMPVSDAGRQAAPLITETTKTKNLKKGKTMPAAGALALQRSLAPPARAEVQLQPGTRVWISLKSVRTRPDGASEFSGQLLLPVTQPGGVVLDQGTQISGLIGTREGKTTIQMTELVWNQARYRLNERGGDAELVPGTATAVRFDAGKVLETWLLSTSVFVRVPDEVNPTSK